MRNFGKSENATQVCRNEIWGYDEEKDLIFIVKSSALYAYKAPVFSPDGKSIAYIQSAPIELGIGSPRLEALQDKGSTEIWVMDLDTKKEYRLTDSRWNINIVSDKVFKNWFYFTPHLEWSPDGLFIHAIYHGQTPNGEFTAEHLIIDVLERKTSQLFSSDYISNAFFTWIDSGNDYVYFDSNRYFHGSVTGVSNEISKKDFETLLPKDNSKCDSLVEAELMDTKLFGIPFYSVSNRQFISDTKQIWKINPTTCELSILFSRTDDGAETYIIENMDGK